MSEKGKSRRGKVRFLGQGALEPNMIQFSASTDEAPRDVFIRHKEMVELMSSEAVDMIMRLRESDDHDLLPSIAMRWISKEYSEHLSLRDLVMVRRYLRKLESTVGEDTLTGLPNRRQYNNQINGRFSTIEQKRKQSEHVQPLTIAVLDIDHFKAVNTAGGHAGGDIVLQELAKIVQSVVRRASDAAFRYGGEEFVITMPNTSAETARMLMERVRVAVEENLLSSAVARMEPGAGRDALEALGVITASIGVSELSAEHSTPEQLFSEADSALYAVKHGVDLPDVTPRNRVAVFTHVMADMHSEHPGARKPNGPNSTSLISILSQDSAYDVPLDTPENIMQQFHKAVHPWKTLVLPTAHFTRRRIYAVDPIQGIKSIFAQPEIENKLLSTPQDAENVQRIDLALRHFERAATVDPLTQLPNRRAYDQELKRELSESTRDFRSRGLIVFDIDKFKRINDTYGHPVGDIALYCFGKVLQEAVEEGEHIFRIGGEEFAVVAQAADVHSLAVVAERIRAQVERLVFPMVQDFLRKHGVESITDRSAFTISMGLAMSSLTEQVIDLGSGRQRAFMIPTSSTELYRQADAALYAAKGDDATIALESWQVQDAQSAGRNRWVAYDPRMQGVKKA